MDFLLITIVDGLISCDKKKILFKNLKMIDNTSLIKKKIKKEHSLYYYYCWFLVEKTRNEKEKLLNDLKINR